MKRRLPGFGAQAGGGSAGGGGVLGGAGSKRKRYAHGNYAAYYGYRGPGDVVDPRVAAMPAEWFQGLRCLDIGCNAGHVTVAIGLHYKPLEILGVDIDRQLIAKERDNLARVQGDRHRAATASF